MKYLVLLSIIAVACAELQPVHLPSPAQPHVEIPNVRVQPIVLPMAPVPEFTVNVVESSEHQTYHVPNMKISMEPDVMEKVQEAVNYVLHENPEQVKVAELEIIDKVKVVDAPLEMENEKQIEEVPNFSVNVVDTPLREQLPETPVVVDAPVLGEVPDQLAVKVVEQPQREIHRPEKVYDNPYLRRM